MLRERRNRTEAAEALQEEGDLRLGTGGLKTAQKCPEHWIADDLVLGIYE